MPSMTEEDWVRSNNIRKMVMFLRRTHRAAQTKHGCRKLRLFVSGCCRVMTWNIPVEQGYRDLVEAAERYADGAITWKELDALRTQVQRPMLPGYISPDDMVKHYASWAMYESAAKSPRFAAGASDLCKTAGALPGSSRKRSTTKQVTELNLRRCNLLRCVFGNPFRPVPIDPMWKSPTVVQLARHIYDDRAFDHPSLVTPWRTPAAPRPRCSGTAANQGSMFADAGSWTHCWDVCLCRSSAHAQDLGHDQSAIPAIIPAGILSLVWVE